MMPFNFQAVLFFSIYLFSSGRAAWAISEPMHPLESIFSFGSPGSAYCSFIKCHSLTQTQTDRHTHTQTQTDTQTQTHTHTDTQTHTHSHTQTHTHTHTHRHRHTH